MMLFYSGMVLWNGMMELVEFFDVWLFVSGPPVGEFPYPCHQKIGSVGRLCCEAVCTYLAATC